MQNTEIMVALTKHITSQFFQAAAAAHAGIARTSFNNRSPSRISATFSSRNADSRFDRALKLVDEFDPRVPLEEAATPPSSWYTDPSYFALELDRVFYTGWQAVGYIEQLKDSNDFFTSRLGNVEFVVCKDKDMKIRAFHNVCRHRASLLASGCGKKSCFVCPYHGWTYGLDGALLKTTRTNGIQNFDVNDFGLVPIAVATWGPFILINLDEKLSTKMDVDEDKLGHEWLGSCADLLSLNGIDASLSFVSRLHYTIECNWKVFCDNFIDGGYHVPYVHKGLSTNLNLDSYSTEIFETVNIQTCKCGGEYGRLGSKAFYVFIYPNFIINRYGPWMETNLVLPLGPRKCLLVSDYFLEASFKVQNDNSFIQKSLDDSEFVQIEDNVLCENVQKGLESPAYKVGRYVPSVEKAVHHFHRLLHLSLTK